MVPHSDAGCSAGLVFSCYVDVFTQIPVLKRGVVPKRL